MAQNIIDLTKSSIVNGIAPHYAYDGKSPLREKLLAITQRVYGGADVSLTPQAEQDLAELEGLGFGSLPVCVAKTQYSLSDDAKKLGAPKRFYSHGPRPAYQRRRRLCGGPGWKYYDHARPSQASGGGEHRHRRGRTHYGPILKLSKKTRISATVFF